MPIEERVHEARKHLKRIRALLLLLRQPLRKRFGRINGRFRNAARRLSAARDAMVVRNVFDRVTAAGVEGADAEALATIGATLRERAAQAELHGGDFAEAVKVVDVALAAARADALTWNLEGYPREEFVLCCAVTYRRARREMRRLRKGYSAEHFHEWRKLVKAHWYHMRLLHDGRRTALRDLGELLGHANDLAVLGELLAAGPVRDAALERTVEQRRQAAVGAALEQGATLFEVPAAPFGVALLHSL
jgi:hypothetical protein